ncbi:MAG TPA: ABC transporter permease [Actinomycetota bacterium]|nr:ABC transporter permease [Actinomycetota bacterium]
MSRTGDLADRLEASPAAPLLAAWRAPRLGLAIRVVAGALLLRVGLNLLLPGRLPMGILVYGAVIGALYGLIAIGLILVYRANQVVNFAQAGMGAVPAVVALLLLTSMGWPYPLTLLFLIVSALALGATVEFLFIRRFSQAPRLILAVVTIGVGQLMAYFEFHTPRWLTGNVLPPTDFPTPFARVEFMLGGTVFRGDHVFAVVVVAACVAALGAFLRLTRLGIAVRASAENAERAALLGVPVARVSTIVWMLAALLSAFGIFLRAPLVGLSLGTIVGPTVLLYALTAAVVARMERLPVAFFAGMAVGAINLSVYYATRQIVLADAAMLPIILVALLVQRAAGDRARDTGISTWRNVKEFRPIPAELRNVREVVAVRAAVAALVVIGTLALPFAVGPLFRNDISMILIYAMIGVSLVILTGWAGQISLGQFAFVGLGAAVAGGLAANHQWDFFATLALAGLTGAVAAVLIGLPALRVQGLFLAVTTLAFAFAVQSFVLNRDFFGWLLPRPGTHVYRPWLYGRIDTGNDLVFYYVCLAFLGLAVVVARQIRSSRSGRILIASRTNVRAAQSYGVNTARTRLAAFAISGFMAAVAGALFAYQQGAVDTGAFPPLNSVKVFAMTVVGGLTNVGGAVAGAVYLISFERFPLLRDIPLLSLLATGVGMVILLMFFPGGFSELGFRARDSFLRWVAARHGIHVPSLVADTLTHEDGSPAAEEPELMSELGETLEHARTDVVVCPVCEQDVPLDEVLDHPHFSSRRGVKGRARAMAAETVAQERVR